MCAQRRLLRKVNCLKYLHSLGHNLSNYRRNIQFLISKGHTDCVNFLHDIGVLEAPRNCHSNADTQEAARNYCSNAIVSVNDTRNVARNYYSNAIMAIHGPVNRPTNGRPAAKPSTAGMTLRQRTNAQKRRK